MSDTPKCYGWECGCVPDHKHTACPLHAKSDVYMILHLPVSPDTPKCGSWHQFANLPPLRCSWEEGHAGRHGNETAHVSWDDPPSPHTSDTPKRIPCRFCDGWVDDHVEGCVMADTPKKYEHADEVAAWPPAPAGLDFEAAWKGYAPFVGRGDGSVTLETVEQRIQAQHRALLADAVAEARREDREIGESWKDAYFRLLRAITGSLLVTEADALARLRAERGRVAPMIAAIAEWQEARKARRTANPFEYDHAIIERCERADKALAALPVPEVTP